MPLREFIGADRQTWQVWDTVPKSAAEDVVFAQNAHLLARAEQRHGVADGAGGGSATARALAGAALRRFTHGREHGWLTFMSGDQKRRLSPIPEGWEQWDEQRLADLLVRAEPVARAHGLGPRV